ncbi:MAG: hypothetical protein IKD70_05485, partial [Eggerthellaceae bacterium]|nr:hypothetical protein [Eggerthellaceae bacterium]
MEHVAKSEFVEFFTVFHDNTAEDPRFSAQMNAILALWGQRRLAEAVCRTRLKKWCKGHSPDSFILRHFLLSLKGFLYMPDHPHLL